MRKFDEKDRETLSQRTFLPRLTDNDVRDFYLKAAEAGLTPEELLENFIGDLIDGTHYNGSDEYDLANGWFDRCWFSFDYYNTFLAFLLKECEYNDFIEKCDIIVDCKLEISETFENEEMSAEDKKEEIAFFSNLISETEKEMRKLFDEYCEENEHHEHYETELLTVMRYRHTLEHTLSEKDISDENNGGTSK